MTLVTITGPATDAAVLPDDRPWAIRATEYQEGAAGGVITPGADWTPLRPFAGVLAFQAESGTVCHIKNPDGTIYLVTIPELDSSLWDVISEGTAMIRWATVDGALVGTDAEGLTWTKTASGEVVRLFFFSPGEHAEYTIGWDNRLAGDDAVASAVFELVDPVDELVETFSPTSTGYNAQGWVRGTPEVGSLYEVACIVTTVMERTLRQVFVLMAAYPAASSSPAAAEHDYITPSADRYWRLPANPTADVLL